MMPIVCLMICLVSANHQPATLWHIPHQQAPKRAAQMFMEGADPAAIVLALRGIRTNEGRRYQVALADVLDLVRAGMR